MEIAAKGPDSVAQKQRVPLLAYTVPVTNKPAGQRQPGETRGGSGREGMRVDWKAIDRVIEWIRSRLYELCLPTERTHILFKYTIDDPVRSFMPKRTLPALAAEMSHQKWHSMLAVPRLAMSVLKISQKIA